MSLFLSLAFSFLLGLERMAEVGPDLEPREAIVKNFTRSLQEGAELPARRPLSGLSSSSWLKRRHHYFLSRFIISSLKLVKYGPVVL